MKENFDKGIRIDAEFYCNGNLKIRRGEAEGEWRILKSTQHIIKKKVFIQCLQKKLQLCISVAFKGSNESYKSYIKKSHSILVKVKTDTGTAFTLF